MLENNNLYELFRKRFSVDMEKPFIVNESGEVFSYRDVESLSGKLANYFQQLGLKVGDRVALQAQKSPQALIVYLACIRSGMIFIPLNTGYTPAELEYFFTDATPALIVGDPDAEQHMRSLAQGIGASFKTLDATGGGSLYAGALKLADDFQSVSRQVDDLAAILYTSGTTGRPKGAMLSHGNLSSNALVLSEYWGFSSNDVLLHVLPIFHVHGLFVACHCVMAAGASMIFQSSFDAEQVMAQLPKSTVMMGVPTYYTRLLANEGFGRDQCNNMRLFISGSAPLLAETHKAFEQRSGHRILERYGMSETSMQISNPLVGERRAGTVGLPLSGVDIRIVDQDNQAVAIGDIGSIQVKGPNVFRGYWNMPEKTAEEFTSDGYFITGDQGSISDDGYISIVGRAKDMVISGGYNVYPKEIELVLDRQDGVKESAVFGVPDTDFGEAVVAAVVCSGATVPSTEQIQTQMKQELASYKVPKRFHFVDELPRNTMGKVQKNALRERYG